LGDLPVLGLAAYMAPGGTIATRTMSVAADHEFANQGQLFVKDLADMSSLRALIMISLRQLPSSSWCFSVKMGI
jgi:hypothetical protein